MGDGESAQIHLRKVEEMGRGKRGEDETGREERIEGRRKKMGGEESRLGDFSQVVAPLVTFASHWPLLGSGHLAGLGRICYE